MLGVKVETMQALLNIETVRTFMHGFLSRLCFKGVEAK